MVATERGPCQFGSVQQGIQDEHEDQQSLEPEARPVGRVGAAEDDP
jgi:hypothetical protein